MTPEFRKQLVVERELVAADRAPVRWIEDQHHRMAAQIEQPQLAIRAVGQSEIRGWSSSRKRLRGSLTHMISVQAECARPAHGALKVDKPPLPRCRTNAK